jgi:peptidyl-prolyl cis-trans isomerase SDCCAG10
MSSVYATEPATSGRVIFETTHGPLDIQLWCRECPATTKFFVQLCLDGYYDNMLFHRIVPSLLIQTGAMRNGEATVSAEAMAEYRNAVHADQALERRPYEVSARIRFNHRGQVAMALGVSDHEDAEDLQPQFFITTEDAPYLDGKHVIFGTVGATIFNAIRICQSEVDESTNAPVDLEHAPRILSTKIVENPIHESLVQLKLPWRVDVQEVKKKKKRKGKLDVNVLSFGDEMGDVAIDTGKEKGIKHSNDVLQSEILSSKQVDAEVEEPIYARRAEGSNGPAEVSLQCQIRSIKDDKVEYRESNPKPIPSPQVTETTTKPKAGYRADEGPDASSLENPMHVSATSLVEARRAKYAKGRKSKQQREEETMAKLLAFRGKIHKGVDPEAEPSLARDDSLASRMARRAQQEEEKEKYDAKGVTYHGQVLDSDGEDDSAWLQTRFKCRRHMDHLAGDGRDADEYQVIDEKRKRDDEHDKPLHKKHRKERKEHR